MSAWDHFTIAFLCIVLVFFGLWLLHTAWCINKITREVRYMRRMLIEEMATRMREAAQTDQNVDRLRHYIDGVGYHTLPEDVLRKVRGEAL